MVNFVDLSGQRFGHWTVISRAGVDKKSHYAMWLCTCDCGTERVVNGRSLRENKSNSCGCSKPMPHGRLEYGEAAFRSLYRYMQHNAKYRNIEWDISWEFFGWITKQPCHYCGTFPYQTYHPKRTNGEYIYNGLDRFDNEIGYIESNCVPCCGVCNYMKSATSVQDFREWVISVYNHWASKS